tara:strand:+ start:69697 stop:70341 length:645 start_codon:yes stop_codon:yes gene_type:complete
MKSQDIGLLLKLESMGKSGLSPQRKLLSAWPHDWKDWASSPGDADWAGDWEGLDLAISGPSIYSARSLEKLTGISKSQINLSLRRCVDVGLAKYDRKTGVPKANSRALYEFIKYGLKYVFPAKPGELVRGIATTFSAPILKDKLLSAGDFKLVWPNADGNTKGLAIEPLFKSVGYAVRYDPTLYAMLALVDAIRIGQPREKNLAQAMLQELLQP